MAKAELTKSHIADNFKILAIKQPIWRVSIRDIVQACDINRNTFYYHFSDKLDLIIWIFRSEFAQIMLEEFSDQKLIYDTKIKGEKYTDLPFYIDARSKACNLDLGEFWLSLIKYWTSQFAYYNHVFCAEDGYSFSDYLYKIYFVQLRQDILYALGEKKLPEEDLNFLTRYFTNASLNYVINAARNHDPTFLELEVNPSPKLSKYNNITHDIIKGLCKEHIQQE